MKVKAHNRYITTLAKHPTKPFLVSGDIDGNIILWNYLTGEMIQSIRQFDRKGRGIRALSFSPDANLLAAVVIYSTTESKLELRETNTWQLAKEFNYPEFQAIAWHPKRDYLALSLGQILDGNSFMEVQKFSPHNYTIQSLMFSETGDILVSGGDNYDATIGILNTRTWELQSKIPDEEMENNVGIAFDAPNILAVNKDAVFINDETGIFRYTLHNQSIEKLPEPHTAWHYAKVALSPDKTLVAFDTIEGIEKIHNWQELYKAEQWSRAERAIGAKVVISDLETGQIIYQIMDFEDSVSAILFLDNQTIAVGGWAGYIRIESFESA